MFFIKFEMFSAISSNILFDPFPLFSPSGTPVMSILIYFMVRHKSLSLSSFIFFLYFRLGNLNHPTFKFPILSSSCSNMLLNNSGEIFASAIAPSPPETASHSFYIYSSYVFTVAIYLVRHDSHTFLWF